MLNKNDMLNKCELLSDLLDDQCSSDELSHLLNDKDTADSWYRYSTVSSILKNEHSAHVDIEFSQKMSALIADEPAIIAAQSSGTVNDINKNRTNVVQFKKSFGGFAIAASVAVATFFSVQTMQTADFEVEKHNVVAESTNVSHKGHHAQSAGEALKNVENGSSQEQYNDLFQLNTMGAEVPVGAEYVKTIRFSAIQWQEILKKAAEQKATQLEASEVQDNQLEANKGENN